MIECGSIRYLPMSWEFVYRCSTCRQRFRLSVGSFRYYVVSFQSDDWPAWERVSCIDEPGWCEACHSPTPIERIPPIASLEAMRDPSFAPAHGRLDAWIRWRRERQSPPRCLVCGATEVITYTPPFRHPNCGGLLEATAWCHVNSSDVQLVPAEGPEYRRGGRRLWEIAARFVRSW